jgi:hypothetical protein
MPFAYWAIFKGMIKYLFILVNSLGFYIISLFSGDNGVKVTGNFPATLPVGKEIEVEIRVAKENIVGFGRLQLDLPEGITVKNVDEKDSEYRYEENKAKWIWASLPEDKEIVIKLTLVASESAIGEREIGARFSYVENNEKAYTDMDLAKVAVVAPGADAIVTEQPKAPVETATPQPPANSNAEPPGEIVVDRIISWNETAKEFIITVKINKGNTKGFARYSDNAFENLTAKSVKTDGSSFSIADGKIKFVWVNVPEKSNLEIAYSLAGSPPNPIQINGEYSYLEDNQSKKIKLQPDTLDFNKPVAPASKPENLASNEKNNTNVPNESKPHAPEGNGKPGAGSSETAKGMEKKDGSASFMVQVGAFTNANVNAGTLQRKFNIQESIKSELQGGFSKFMVGSHKEYKEARGHRETMVTTNGVKSAFVVAYNYGKRITVQEALMVTNQKWFK